MLVYWQSVPYQTQQCTTTVNDFDCRAVGETAYPLVRHSCAEAAKMDFCHGAEWGKQGMVPP